MATVTDTECALIIEYWFRLLLNVFFSIQDIAQIIFAFGRIYEQFDKSLIHKNIVCNDDYRRLGVTKFEFPSKSAFGKVVASAGRLYHWKIRILSGTQSVNIGLLELSKCKHNATNWWCFENGYSFYTAGELYNYGQPTRKYGNEIQDDGVVDVWLDLKEKNNLSFGQNGASFGKAFDINPDIQYKLAVSIYLAEIELVSFEMK